MTNLHAAFITPAATRWLQTTRTARILNIFDRACNLVNQDNAVLALVTSERSLTPFGLVIANSDSSPFQSLDVNSPISMDANANRLRVGELSIDTSLASPWSPTPDWSILRALFVAEPDRLDHLAALVLELAAPGSLLDLYVLDGAYRINANILNKHPEPVEGCAPINTHEIGPRISRLLHTRAGEGALKLVQGLRKNEEALCIEGARLLAGLGGGLTPAGDDFMAGALLAMWAGLYGPGREPLALSIVETAAPLTTTLSAAYLRAAAQGECIIHWHHLFAALQTPDLEAIRTAAQSLLSIGHTSGADGLAGFLAARMFQ